MRVGSVEAITSGLAASTTSWDLETRAYRLRLPCLSKRQRPLEQG